MKKLENILDSHLIDNKDKSAITSIESQLLENEKLIWTGKPKYEFSLTPLEVGGYDVALGPTNLYFIALGLNWFYSYLAFNNGKFLKSMLLFLLGLAIFSLPDLIKEIRRRNTYYAISDKRIFFKLWGLRKNSRVIEHFNIEQISDLRYEEFNNKSGILYFILKEPPKFKTYDFSAGGSRHYPTFENINKVILIQNLIKDAKETQEKIK